MKAEATKALDANESSEGAAEDGQAKPRIQSAVRTISVLLAVADSPNGLKAKEIMEKLGLSRQVTYHLIHTMHGTGIIRKNDSNRYVLGLATVSIAEGFSRQLAPPEHLARRVRSIVAATGETAYAGGWVDGEIVALATARGESPVGAAQVPQGYSGYAMHERRESCFWRWSSRRCARPIWQSIPWMPGPARPSRIPTNSSESLNEFDPRATP